MKVCLLSASVQGLGGAEALVRMLANGLVERGHQVQVISLDRESPPVDSNDELFETVNINSRASDRYALRETSGPLYKAWWQLRCLRNPLLLEKLKAAVRKFQPDVIHTHKVRGFPRDLWPRLKEATGCPLVHTCHDIELLSPLHTIAVGSRNPVTRLFLGLWAGIARPSSSFVSTVTSPSDFMLGLHRSARLFADAKPVVISNFPDLAGSGTFRQLQNPAVQEPLRILFMGRLVKVKGILPLCEAVQRMSVSGQPVELRIAGDGPLREEVEHYRDLHEFIHYESVVAGKEKMKLFDWAHIVAAPAIYDETFCLVAAEAITALRPVLASGRGGLPEVVSDGITGWIYKGEGPQAILRGLRRVQDCRPQFSEYSARCRLEADRFSAKNLINSYESIYEDSLRRQASSQGR